jgi:Uma2 family endonuclease
MSTILEETAGRVDVAWLTVDQYEAMIARSILEEGAAIELIDGLLVRKDRAASGGEPRTIGPAHQLVLKKIGRLAAKFEEHGCHLSIQGPVRIPPQDEPEPDAAVVAGTPEDYAMRHPGPADVHSVIEVADSSLAKDRTTKLRIYATAGIRQYVIVNLVDRTVELHEAPRPAEGRYASTPVFAADDPKPIKIAAGDGRGVATCAKELLP